MATVAHFSLEHYERMVKLGAFDAPFRKRLELIRGEIVEMSPIGSEHAYIIDKLNDWSHDVAPRDQIAIRIQNPIRVPASDSEPEPDLVWAVRKNYAERHPEPQEVLLIVEVAGHVAPGRSWRKTLRICRSGHSRILDRESARPATRSVSRSEGESLPNIGHLSWTRIGQPAGAA
jgi:Uma2 family endonuclease